MRISKMYSLVFLLATWMVPNPSLAARSVRGGQLAVPAGADLEKYPLQNGALSVSFCKEVYDLKMINLAGPWTGFNHYRGLRGNGRWVFETLPAGTLVCADEKNNPIYKADCGNRLVATKKCPVCPTIPIAANAGSRSDGVKTSTLGFWDRHSAFRQLLEDLLLWILLLAALLLLLALAYLLWTFLQRRFEEMRPIGKTPPSTESERSPRSNTAQNTPSVPPSSSETDRRRGWMSSYHASDGKIKVKWGGHKEFHLIREGEVFTARFR